MALVALVSEASLGSEKIRRERVGKHISVHSTSRLCLGPCFQSDSLRLDQEVLPNVKEKGRYIGTFDLASAFYKIYL